MNPEIPGPVRKLPVGGSSTAPAKGSVKFILAERLRQLREAYLANLERELDETGGHLKPSYELKDKCRVEWADHRLKTVQAVREISAELRAMGFNE